ncbi:DUF1515 family protein [Rhizobium sp. CSW-27]|uniref:DUF1515 family protein n=1 Tax=Rhizobium sp. CSW-27 TaxID=2839985 RepID=UPI001C01C071|nr:DUF1515 family protein [Rhizobium sp. CSW-27]MBT9373172.1 DUF1515 domain-containing protein [Rhizobium sp. CSW-27]
MMDGIDAGVHRQLGELVEGLRGVKDDMREIKDMMARSEDRSTENRARMHRRMDDMVGRVGAVEANVADVQRDIAQMKPVTDDVRRWKLMGMGGLGVIGLGGMALGVSFADALKRIATLLLGRL